MAERHEDHDPGGDAEAGPGEASGSVPVAGGPGGSGSDGDAADADYESSLVGLARLATGALTLPEMLVHVAEFAVRAIPGADGVGLTVLAGGRADTVVCSADFVRAVDDVQYGLGEGPCIDAAATGRTVRSGSLGGDRTWPRFGPRVSRLGVHSALSLPLLGPEGSEGPVGAMNVYAHTRDAFTARAVELGELFAVPASIAVRNALALAEARAVAAQLQRALGSRAGIDRAVGVVMSRSGVTAEEAFDRLRTISQAENRKVAAVAQSLVEEAVRRARSRHTEQ